VYGSPYLNCPRGAEPYPGTKRDGYAEGWTQTWYDDANSTKLKVAAAKRLGLGGVGVFTAENVGGGEKTLPMWAALKSFKTLPMRQLGVK
jgi:hypothetical protein